MLTVSIGKKFQSSAAGGFTLQVREEFASGFTVVFGPSGAGKSTLLDCVAGLTRPDEGRIALGDKLFFDAERPYSLETAKRRTGYVFQSLALFPHLTVEKNVGYGLLGMAAGERAERIRKICRAFHLEGRAGRKPSELSGGEKQRVALARSLVTQPQLLLLDEPLTGLDAHLRGAILEDLRNWNRERRIPILYVTHNREEVEAIGERVVALENGRVRQTGLPLEVLDAPHALGLAQASGFENLFTGRIVERRPSDGVMRVELGPPGCDLEIPFSSSPLGAQIQVAVRAGDILLAREGPRGLSARNVLNGGIVSLDQRGTLVVVRVKAGLEFTVHVTPGAVRALGLEAGQPVWLVVKTHSCHEVRPH